MVGAGGNGSIFITHLCRIWQAWTKLGGKPFEITIHDPDTVSEANLARQCFCEADIGLPKALVLAQRMRSFFGVPITHRVSTFTYNHFSVTPDIIVGCVDNLAARRQMADACATKRMTRHQWGQDTKETRPGCYWLDMGNSDNSGQVVLGGHGLKTFFDVLPQTRKARDPKNLPSCSMAESLTRQDLFINSTIATLAGHLLWRLMRNGGLNHHGYFVNLGEGLVLPIAV